MTDLIATIRDEAARLCDETARQGRGERSDITPSEFSQVAFALSAVAALAALEALKRMGAKFTADFGWEIAAALLRAGWNPGETIDLVNMGRMAKA